MVFPDRAAQVGSEVVAFKGRLRKVVSEIVTRLIEEIARVEHLVAQEIKAFTVPVVGPGARRDMNDGSRVAAVLRTVSRIVGFKLLHRVDRGLKGNLAVGHIVQVDAVDQEVDRVFPIARGIDGKGALSAQRSCKESVLGRGDGARQQQPEINKVASVQRDLLHRALVDYGAHSHGALVDDRGFGGNRNHIGRLRHR